jgi:hypothetical protein
MIKNNPDWLSVKKHGLPEIDCLCWTTCSVASYECHVAHYSASSKSFREHDPTNYYKPALHVTHYVVLPWGEYGMEE